LGVKRGEVGRGKCGRGTDFVVEYFEICRESVNERLAQGLDYDERISEADCLYIPVSKTVVGTVSAKKAETKVEGGA
jgi:hypothetical protein